MEPQSATRKFQKELNAGAISLVLLQTIVRARRPTYGYEIARQLEAHAEGDLPMNQGALYPVLRSLEKTGLLSSEVQPSTTGPPRRYYRATPEGKRILAEWQSVWENTKRFVDSALEKDHATAKHADRSAAGRKAVPGAARA